MFGYVFGLKSVLALATVLGGQNPVKREISFDFKDPKEISAISLMIDSKLEPIVGWAKGISGTVRFDPEHPMKTAGDIAVDATTIQFANDGYTATARGFALESKKYPKIEFKLRKVLNVSSPVKSIYQATVLADFKCKGITIPLTLLVKASYFPRMAEERTNGKYKGDVLVIRTNFNISRTKFGISDGIPANLVDDTIGIRVAIVGIHYADKRPDPISKP